TSFSMSINFAASFNMSLMHHITGIISTEAHVFNNDSRGGSLCIKYNHIS
ncbi:unnamed protein product, partial [Rotaria sp. Silwood1]